MAVKASASITLSFMVDIQAVYRYYKLQSSTATKPGVPTTNPPSGWTDSEPSYTSGSTNTLYFVDLTVFTNGTYLYSAVSKSSAYEAAKEAYNKAEAAKEAVDNMEIGGRNLLTKAHLSQDALKEYGIHTYANTKTGTSYIFSELSLEPGIYVYSLRIKRTEGIDTGRIRLFKNGTTVGYYRNPTTDGKWSLLIIPITVTSAEDIYGSQIYNHNFGEEFDPEVSIKNPKIELGNMATDWTPAPEDVAEDITNSADEIRQEMVDQNASIITSCNEVILSALESYVQTSDYGEFKETVETALSVLAGEVSINLTTTNEQLEAINADLQDKFNKITTYFTFEVDGLTIGRTDSPYKVVQSNDRYTMYVNDTEVLWIDIETREVHTPELTITDRFRMLGYQMEKDASGNVNWEYIGG